MVLTSAARTRRRLGGSFESAGRFIVPKALCEPEASRRRSGIATAASVYAYTSGAPVAGFVSAFGCYLF
jgi:energy-converting hydrogenase Eha subunit B